MDILHESSPALDEREALIIQAQSGDMDAMGQIWQQTVPSVMRKVERTYYAEAEDIAQETAIKVMTRLDQYRPGTNFNAWTGRIAANAAIDAVRRSAARPSVPVSPLPDEETGLPSGLEQPVSQDSQDAPEQAGLQAASAESVAGVLACMSPDYRDILQEIAINGLSYDEYAVKAGIRLGTVKSRYNRARNNILQLIDDGQIVADRSERTIQLAKTNPA